MTVKTPSQIEALDSTQEELELVLGLLFPGDAERQQEMHALFAPLLLEGLDAEERNARLMSMADAA